MSINADKPQRWKADIAASVDLFNKWFLAFAPKAYRETRLETTKQVEEGLVLTHDLTAITPEVLKAHPSILPILRMASCPPLARDRLVGLAGANKSLVLAMERGRLPIRMPAAVLNENLERVCGTVGRAARLGIA